MAEFGEQLRKAREERGMTQQSLAEKVYVTRQTVSRWEGGERYPDLITLKQLARILGVDADYLLSDGEEKRIAERSQVVDKPSVNNISIVLFAAITAFHLVSVIEIFIRIPYLLSMVTAADICVVAGNAVSDLINIAAFTTGFVLLIKGVFTPKRVGAVMVAFFTSTCIRQLAILTFGVTLSSIFTVLALVLIAALGAVSAGLYFSGSKATRVWSGIIVVVSALGIIRSVLSLGSLMKFSSAYISSETVLSFLLAICTYVLFIYQTYQVHMKRKRADSIST